MTAPAFVNSTFNSPYAPVNVLLTRPAWVWR
jgi:hypothetical protein